MTITLTSPDFDDGGRIPTRLTCDGDDDSPALSWEGLPAGTAEVALLVEDPDAPGGTFVHWVLWESGQPAASCPPGSCPPAPTGVATTSVVVAGTDRARPAAEASTATSSPSLPCPSPSAWHQVLQ